jgi:hypothetical protein
MAQTCYIAIMKSAEGLDRPQKDVVLFARASFDLGPLYWLDRIVLPDRVEGPEPRGNMEQEQKVDWAHEVGLCHEPRFSTNLFSESLWGETSRGGAGSIAARTLLPMHPAQRCQPISWRNEGHFVMRSANGLVRSRASRSRRHPFNALLPFAFVFILAFLSLHHLPFASLPETERCHAL